MDKIEFNIRIADKVIRVYSLYETTKQFCEEYIVHNETPEYCVVIMQDDIAFERKKSESEDIKEGIPVRYFSDAYLETLAVYRKIAELLIDENIILFHGSVIAVDNEGYIFTAKSGTGKSTHTRLWREVFGNRAVMINDDKPLLKITDNGIYAYGTPWDGKHRLSTNTSVPVKGICILQRDINNHIEKLSKKEAYPMMLQQTHHPVSADKMIKLLSLIDKMFEIMKIYRLGCNMDKEAAVIAYEKMSGRTIT